MLQIRNDIHQPGSCVWLLGRVLQVTALLVCLSCPRCVLALSETSRQDLWHGAHSTVHIPSAAAALDSSGHVPWKQRLLSSGSASTQTAFEQALAATFNNASATDPSTTLAQFSTLLNIVVSLGRSNKPYLRYVPELHSSTVQALMSDAVLFATSSLGDSSKLLELLASISKHIHQLHAEFGYPATRRIILGCILKKRMDFKNALSPQLQAAVDKVLLQLFNIHKRSAAAKGAVQFLHISKSGGTNLCMAAEQNSCTTEGFSEKHNCLVKEFNDIPRWVTAHAHKYVQYRITSLKATPWFVNFHALRRTFTCQERLKALRKAGWNFYANEFSNPPAQSAYFTLARSGTLGNAMTYSALDVALDMDESAASTLNATSAPIAFLCEEFVNLMLFRNPYDRLRSQIAWIQKLYKEFYTEYLESDIKLAFLQRSSGFWERLLPAGVNNYYIRSLLGPRFFEFPMIHITRDHVLLAKLAALQYDVLLSLEHGAFNDASLRVGLGWEHALKKAQIRSSSGMAEEVCLPPDFSRLLEVNAPDMELHEFAREMQTLDVLLWHFIALVDDREQGLGLTTVGGSCGYVSAANGTSAATARVL